MSNPRPHRKEFRWIITKIKPTDIKVCQHKHDETSEATGARKTKVCTQSMDLEIGIFLDISVGQHVDFANSVEDQAQVVQRRTPQMFPSLVIQMMPWASKFCLDRDGCTILNWKVWAQHSPNPYMIWDGDMVRHSNAMMDSNGGPKDKVDAKLKKKKDFFNSKPGPSHPCYNTKSAWMGQQRTPQMCSIHCARPILQQLLCP